MQKWRPDWTKNADFVCSLYQLEAMVFHGESDFFKVEGPIHSESTENGSFQGMRQPVALSFAVEMRFAPKNPKCLRSGTVPG